MSLCFSAQASPKAFRCIAVSTVRTETARVFVKPGYGYGETMSLAQQASLVSCEDKVKGEAANGCSIYKCQDLRSAQ